LACRAIHGGCTGNGSARFRHNPVYQSRETAGLKKTLQKYLPVMALVSGFIWAFVATGVHSMLFALLPLVAFLFGYYSTWWWGLLNGFLLFLGYAFATILMWFGFGPNLIYPIQYLVVFIFGGFSLPLTGALAPLAKNGFRKIRAVVTLIILAFFMVWCGFHAWPAYSYYYQVIIHTSEDVDNLELYLPTGVVREDIYEELYDNPLDDPGARLTENYSDELVDTEYGQMLKLTLPEPVNEGPPDYPYTWNVIFRQPELEGFRNSLAEMIMPWLRQSAPHQLIKLTPRYDTMPVDRVKSQEHIGPLKVGESKIIEEFKVPIMVKADVNVNFDLKLENRTESGGWINFTYSKLNTYTEIVRYEGSTGNEWVLVPAEVTNRLTIQGSFRD
jgi:hypothetical protein